MSTLRFKLLTIWLLGLLLVILTIQTIFWVFPENPYNAKKKDFELQAENIEALVMGVSHARAIHFPSLGIPGYSFHDPGSDLQTVSEKYRTIAPLMPNLKYVLLPLSPSYLHIALSDKKKVLWESRFFSNYPERTNFRGSLYWSLLLNEPKYLLQKLRKSLKNTFRRLTSSIQFSNKSPPCMPKSPRDKPQQDGFVNGYFDIYAKEKCINDLAISTRNKHFSVTLENNGPEGNFERNKFIMDGLIQQIAAHGHQLVLFIPPFTAEYYEHSIWNTIKAEQLKYLEELSLQPNVQFLDHHDFFYQRNYIEHNNLFFDDDHLGLNGAIEFSKILGQEIGEYEGR